MRLNIHKINRLLWGIALLLLVGGGIAAYLLNDAQRIVIAGGVGLCLLNLVVLSFFLNKNANRGKNNSRRR